MTAIPVPPISRIDDDEDEKIADEKLKKNLLRDFDTPLVVSKRISRLSEKFEQLPSEYVIKAFLRLRPFTESEIRRGENEKCLKISDDRHILTAMAPKDSKVFKASNRGVGESVQHFTFTKIFDENTTQNDFYQQTAHPLVKEFVNGNNGLIFTYGVTNSGKTYTLQGSRGNEGVIPQAITNVFHDIGDKMMDEVPFVPKMGSIWNLSDNDKNKHKLMKKQVLALADDTRYSGSQKTILLDSSSDLSQIDSCNTTASDNSKLSFDQSDIPVKYAVFVSFVELYCEQVYDLLAPISDDRMKAYRSRPTLNIADDKKGMSHIKGMREIQANSAQEVLKILEAGQKNLSVAATKLNKDSSRSHCIFTITLVQVKDVPNPYGARISKISFCDLAGSERSSKTGEAGDRLKEAGNINNSLMKLGMCIANLRHNQRFKNETKKQRTVSFRESKLTRLFRNYLLGEGRACMIVNANMCASGFDETLHVLKFSAVAREVQIINKPRLSNRPPKRSSTSLDDDIFVKNKSSRMTIGWENKMPAIKDVDESTENENESESESESDSESLEESVYECDVEYWKGREKKYEEIVEMLRNELRRVRNEMSEKEKDIRRQCYENTRSQIVQIQESHEEHIEDTIAILTEEQEQKKQIMVDLAMNDIKLVKGRYEEKMWDLTTKITSLENELKTYQDKLDEKVASLNVSENKVTGLEVKVNELQMDIDKKTQEAYAAKRQSRLSAAGQDDTKEDLITQIEEGKSLIRSLMEEADEKGKQIEDMQEENDKFRAHLTNLQQNTKKVVEEETSKRMKLHENELLELKKEKENLQFEISEMEKKSEKVIKTQVDGSQEIVILDDAKSLKCTEGILQHLLESSETKDEQIMLLTTNLEETKSEMITVREKSSAAHRAIDILRKTIPLIKNDLIDSKMDIAQQQKMFKSFIDDQVSSIFSKIELSTSQNDVELENFEAEKNELITKYENSKQQILKLNENETKLNEKVAELQKLADSMAANKNAESERLKRFENEVHDKVEILKDLRAEMREKEMENGDLKTQLANANKLLEEARSNYNKETKYRNSESEKLKKLEGEIQDKKETIKELRSDIREREKRNKEVESNFEDVECKNKELQKNLDDITMDNDIREEKIVMLQLKMDEVREEKESLDKEILKIRLEIKKKESENQSLIEKQQDFDAEIITLENALKKSKEEIENLMKEQRNLSKAQNTFDSEKSDMEKALERKEMDYEKLQTTYQEYRTRMEHHIEETNKYHKEELENIKNRHAEELGQSKADLARNKTAADTKQEEFDVIKENKDKCIKAFEIQISHEKASNKKLRSELDEQMSEVVKLQSKHAAATAEISELKKQLEHKENAMRSPFGKPKKNESDDIQDWEPQIRLEPLAESIARSNSRRTRKKSDTVASTDSSYPKTRSRRATKRGSSILKRGKCSTRPATPLPEATSDDEAAESSPQKKSRPADSSLKNEERGVLDDSELLKETGNVRGFPEPEIEIDATPSTSTKKSTRTRKKTNKKSDESEDPDFKIMTTKPVRRRKAKNTNNSNSNTDDVLASPSFSSVARNINQVGTLIKNSPVGNALKRIEEVISPATKSPKKSRRAVETKRGKRILGPEDISSPLEASPDPVLQDFAPPVLNTPTRKLRSLRNRK